MPRTPTPEWLAEHEELHRRFRADIDKRDRTFFVSPESYKRHMALLDEFDRDQAEDDRLEAQTKGDVRKGNK